MRCEEVRGNFSDFLERELNLEHAMRVHSHLGTCKSCASEIGSLERSMEMVRRLDPVPVTKEFSSRLKERLQSEKKSLAREERKGRSIRRFLFPGLIVETGRSALVAAATVGAVLVLQSGWGRPEGPPPGLVYIKRPVGYSASVSPASTDPSVKGLSFLGGKLAEQREERRLEKLQKLRVRSES